MFKADDRVISEDGEVGTVLYGKNGFYFVRLDDGTIKHYRKTQMFDVLGRPPQKKRRVSFDPQVVCCCGNPNGIPVGFQVEFPITTEISPYIASEVPRQISDDVMTGALWLLELSSMR